MCLQGTAKEGLSFFFSFILHLKESSIYMGAEQNGRSESHKMESSSAECASYFIYRHHFPSNDVHLLGNIPHSRTGIRHACPGVKMDTLAKSPRAIPFDGQLHGNKQRFVLHRVPGGKLIIKTAL